MVPARRACRSPSRCPRPLSVLDGAVLALQFELLAGLENFRGRTAGDDGLELPPVQQAAADVVDQLAHRDLADFDFVIAGLLHVAADAEDARAGVVRRAELRVFRAAHLDDVLHVAERLDVVHDGRAHVEAEHRREIRRLDARIGALAFERFDQAGLLAADVSARAAMDVDLADRSRCRGCSCRGNPVARASCERLLRMLRAFGNSPRM